MSQENVEIVRELLVGFAEGDHERAFDRYSPDIEWDVSGFEGSMPTDLVGVYHGHEGVRTYWRGWLSAWRDLQFEVQDVLGADDEVVALIRNQRQRGRHSGVPTEVPPFGMVFTIRHRKVVRVRAYPDQQSALEAAGLEKVGHVGGERRDRAARGGP